MKYIRRSRGEHALREDINNIEVPDAWSLAQHIRGTGENHKGQDVAEIVLDLWYLAHDLKRALQHAADVMEDAASDGSFFDIHDLTQNREAL